MLSYLAKRALAAIPTLLLVGVAVFVLVRLVPGDPALVMLGDSADDQALADARAAMGLDKPVVTQFVIWLEHAVKGDLGTSLMTGEAVGPLLLDRFAVSAPIVLIAVALATAIAVVAGLWGALHQGKAADLLIVTGATVLLSIPSFWLGLMLLLVFGLELGWLPVVGYVPFSQDPHEAVRFLVLPSLALALIEAGVLTRMMRASAIEVQRLDYVLHARAKGLDDDTVLSRHVFPNAFAPTLTLIGLVLGNLLGGIAVIETVFTLPGLGRLMVDAVLARDYPVIQACLLFTATIYIVVNLVVDLVYPAFDPRIVNR